MVGIPGKSRACHDCKARRVKCDQSVPLCLRCSKAGIACRGYDRKPLWVNSTLDQPVVTALDTITQARRERLREGCLGVSEWAGLIHQLGAQLQCNDKARRDDPRDFRLKALPILQDIYLPQRNTVTNFEDSGALPSSWLESICNMQGPSKALDHALLAFCAVQVRLSGESTISYDETLQLYNYALGVVISDLGAHNTRTNDETLGAILVLSTCELFMFQASTSWRAHAQGISELLRYHEALEPISPSRQSLYRRLFVICFIQAMVYRESLSLGSNKWRQFIRVEDHSAGSFAELLHIIIDLPSILQHAHTISFGFNYEERERIEGSNSCIALLNRKYQQLRDWGASYLRIKGLSSDMTPLYWTVPSRVCSPADGGLSDQLFPFAINYSSIQRAALWIFRSTIMVDVLDTILLLLPTATDYNMLYINNEAINYEGRKEDVKSTIEADADKLARMLCQSMEFCFRTENGTFGAQTSCSTQAILQRYFSRRGLTRELEWCRSIKTMKGPGTRFNIDVMHLGRP